MSAVLFVKIFFQALDVMKAARYTGNTGNTVPREIFSNSFQGDLMMNQRKHYAAALAVLLCCFYGLCGVLAQNPGENKEKIVAGQVKTLGLFKNGVVVVQEEIQVPGSGTFLLPEVPSALHGTFFLESEALVETTVTERQVFEPLSVGETLDYQTDLAGKAVVVYTNQPEIRTISGTVAVLKDAKPAPGAGSERIPSYYDSYAYRNNLPPQPVGNLSSKLILETEEGQVILERSAIIRVDLKEKVTSVKHTRPAMVFRVKTEKPAVIHLFYLTRGISWAPSYRIDTTDPKQLSVEQTAILINELKSFENAEVSLISGFPKIECENVYAPFVPGNSLDAFFQQLANRTNPSRRSSMMTQQAVYTMNSVMPSMPGDSEDSSVAVSGEGPDIHFQNIGLRSMNRGDRLVISTGKAAAGYERVVEWTVPDTRDDNGRFIENRDQMVPSDPWDTLRFRNPLPFPMTTGPATIVAGGKFYGQNSSFWASPGEMTKIPVTKSMSVRVKAVEYEKETDTARPRVFMWGREYRRATVAVELTIVNRRAEPVQMLVNRRFSGELEKEVPDANVTALTENLNRANRLQEIQWEFSLASGETKTLRYTYVTLIY